jgi:iron complex outermembrane receptor protein
MKKVIAQVCLLMLVAAHAAAQPAIADTLRQLKEVTVVSNRMEHFNTGNKIEQMDSLTMVVYQHQSLATLLGAQNALFIKSYGPGSLASSSFRGAGAEQTAVLWNGFNLQSALNGQIDFSLFQVDLMDELFVQYGSNGALFGSGAVGGVIHIGNRPKFGSGFHAALSLQGGSFGNTKENISLNYGSKRLYSSLRLINQQAKNDFPYQNSFFPGSPVMNQVNAAYTQQAVLSDNYLLLGKDQQLNFRAWYQSANRQIPPPMSVPDSKATQWDEALRISSEWSLQRRSVSYFVRSAWFDERLNYNDSVSGIQSHNRAHTWISEGESKLTLSSNQFLNIGLNNTYTYGACDAYATSVSQNRTALFASYKLVNTGRTWSTVMSMREELYNGTMLPVMPSLGMEWKLSRSVTASGNVSRSYRVPTLNERYWNPGGDPNLKPEQGWAEELSLNGRRKLLGIHAELTATVFNRVINDWIQWLPVGSYWSPRNTLQVWSRGMEGKLRLAYAAGRWNIVYTGRINEVLSTVERSDNANSNELHKQLIYVPRLNYANQLSASYRTFFVLISQTYTGIRFTQSDASDWLMYYILCNVSAGREFSCKRCRIAVSAQLNNLFNEPYQVIEYRPMPGRNFLIGLTITI